VIGERPAGDLVDEREQLLRSIEDLDREHESGELEETDYAQVRAGYVARAAAVLRAIEERGPESSGPVAPAVPAGRRSGALRRSLGRRRTRVALGAGLAVCVAGLVVLFALRAAGVRLPGETVTGSVQLNQDQQVQAELVQAQELGSAGDLSEALSLYQQILKVEPRQPEALAYRGWLLRLTGLEVNTSTQDSDELIAAGRSSIEEALAVEPGYGDAHLFLGISLLEDTPEDLKGSITQFRLALADDVSPALLDAEKPILARAFEADHQAVPEALSP
jgi:tetratricopeptide (TPR) repeat protein